MSCSDLPHSLGAGLNGHRAAPNDHTGQPPPVCGTPLAYQPCPPIDYVHLGRPCPQVDYPSVGAGILFSFPVPKSYFPSTS